MQQLVAASGQWPPVASGRYVVVAAIYIYFKEED